MQFTSWPEIADQDVISDKDGRTTTSVEEYSVYNENDATRPDSYANGSLDWDLDLGIKDPIDESWPLTWNAGTRNYLDLGQHYDLDTIEPTTRDSRLSPAPVPSTESTHTDSWDPGSIDPLGPLDTLDSADPSDTTMSNLSNPMMSSQQHRRQRSQNQQPEAESRTHKREFSEAATMVQPLVLPGFNDSVSPVSPGGRALHTPVRRGSARSFDKMSVLDSPSSVSLGAESPLMSPTYQSPFTGPNPNVKMNMNLNTNMAPSLNIQHQENTYTPMQARRLSSASSPRSMRKMPGTPNDNFMLNYDPSTLGGASMHGKSPNSNPVDVRLKGAPGSPISAVMKNTGQNGLASPHSMQGMPLSSLPEVSNTQIPEPALSPRKEKPKEGKRDGRKRIAKEQIEVLEAFFQANPRPERDDRLRLASETSLEQRTVQIWFQNRRAKSRAMKAAKESDAAVKRPHSVASRGASTVNANIAAAAVIAADGGYGSPMSHQQQMHYFQQQQQQQQHQQQSMPYMPYMPQQQQYMSRPSMVPDYYRTSNDSGSRQFMPFPPNQPLGQQPQAHSPYTNVSPRHSQTYQNQYMNLNHRQNPPPLLRSQSLPTCDSGIQFPKDVELGFQDISPPNARRADSVASVSSMGPGLPVSPINSVDGLQNFSPEIVTDTEDSPDATSNSPVSWNHNPWGWNRSSNSLNLSNEWNQPGAAAPEVKRRRSVVGSGSGHSSQRSEDFMQHRAFLNSAPSISEMESNGSLAVSAAAAALKGRHRSNTQPIIRQRQPSIRLQLDETSSSARLVVVPELDAKLSNQLGFCESPSDRAERAAMRVMAERPGSTPLEKNN